MYKKLFLFLLTIFLSLNLVFSFSQITSISASQITSDSIYLTWNSSQEINDWNYRIFRDGLEVGFIENNNFFNDTSLEGNTQYTYSIQAYNDTFTEDQSTSIPFFTLSDPQSYPLFSLDDLNYEGAFRLQSGAFGDGNTGFSPSKLAYNYDDDTLFVQGRYETLGEYPIEEFIISNNIDDLNIAGPPIQNFSSIYDRTDTGNIQGLNRITGIYHYNDQVYVNSNQWYDAPADNTHTTLVVRDSSDIENSEVDGFFEFSSAAKGAGWMVPIPEEWQSILGGDHITGYSSADSIISRFSVGPSAYVFNIEDFENDVLGPINTNPILSFPYPEVMHNPSQFSVPNPSFSQIVYNHLDGGIQCVEVEGEWECDYNQSKVFENDVWTINSKAYFGFIVPGTRTYATFGSSYGHNNGIGYKIVQDDGTLCGGPCPYNTSDSYNYYWLFDMDDMVSVKNGDIDPWDVFPYESGEFVTPFDFVEGNFIWGNYASSDGRISAGTFNYRDNILYLTIPGVDFAQNYYSPSDLILGYSLDRDNSNDNTLNPFPVISSLNSPSQTDSSVYLEWSYTNSDDITKYLIFRDSVNIANTTTPNFNDTSVSIDLNYSYSIQAYNTPSISSFISDPIVISTMSLPSLPGVFNIQVESSLESLYLSWEYEHSDINFRIYDNSSTIIVDNLDTTFFNHTNLTSNTIYYYSIEAFNDTISNLSLTFNGTTLVPQEDDSSEENDSNSDDDSSEEDDSDSGSSSSSSSSSSGSSNSRPPSSSSTPVTDVKEPRIIEETQEGKLNIKSSSCQSLFSYTPWSECINDTQERTRIDEQSCIENSLQVRSCSIDSEKNSVIYLKSNSLSLEISDEPRFFSSSFESGREYFSKKEDLGNSFIVYNSDEGLDYLGRKIDLNNDTYYYSLEVIDQDLLNSGILENEGLLEISTLERTQNIVDDTLESRHLPTIIIVISIFSFIIFIFAIVFYLKKHSHRSPLKSTHNLQYLDQINKYIEKHPDLSSLEVRKKLEEVGWKKEILDSVFNNK